MILLVVVFLGLYFPLHYYGGLGAMFAAIEQAKPGFTVLPEQGESVWWFSFIRIENGEDLGAIGNFCRCDLRAGPGYAPGNSGRAEPVGAL